MDTYISGNMSVGNIGTKALLRHKLQRHRILTHHGSQLPFSYKVKVTRVHKARPQAASAVANAFAPEGWALWAVLAATASAAQVSQSKSKAGQLLSAPLLAILFGLLLAAAGVLPVESPIYNQISSNLLPLAAALYLLESDLKELTAAARGSLAAFCLATLGTVAGTVVAWLALGSRLGSGGWKVAAALAASYVGGSVNFAATAAALGATSGSLLAAAMSADMVAMAGYLALLSWWPVPSKLEAAKSSNGSRMLQEASVDSLGLSIAAAATACALGSNIASGLGIPGFSLGLVAILASIFGSLGAGFSLSETSKDGTQAPAKPFKGAEAMGGALMSFFFVTIGAAAGSLSAVLSTGWLLAFIAIQLGVHLAVTMGLGTLLQIPTKVLLTASNAAVGGPGTAAAMATSRGWNALVRPALIIGALGYSIGTTIGVGMGHFIHAL